MRLRRQLSGALPDRRHHFADRPVAQAVIATATQNLPPREGPNMMADLRTLVPPLGFHAGNWHAALRDLGCGV